MRKERAMELLNQVVEHVCVAENTNNSISTLLSMGFEPKELVDEFHFSQSDMDDYLEENDNDLEAE